MKHKTILLVLGELRRREYCSEQWQRPSAQSIANCTGVSLSTVKRYLKRLVMFGLADSHLYDYRGDPAKGYTISKEGIYWLDKAKEAKLS